MEGHKGDKEQDLQRKMNVLDEENDGIWREMDVENKSSRSWSPPAIDTCKRQGARFTKENERFRRRK